MKDVQVQKSNSNSLDPDHAECLDPDTAARTTTMNLMGMGTVRLDVNKTGKRKYFTQTVPAAVPVKAALSSFCPPFHNYGT